MNILKKIKLKLANWVLKRKEKSLKRNKAVYNFDTARTVGVIFSLDDASSYKTIKEFLDFLSDKKLRTYTIGYCREKNIPNEFIGHSRINAFTFEDLNWYYKPKSVMIKQFMEKNFDILFDLTTLDQFPTKYVNNLTKASFKVGKESGNGKDHDMVIRLSKDQNLPYFIDQIKYYISRINKEE